jgi:hypothetical protein
MEEAMLPEYGGSGSDSESLNSENILPMSINNNSRVNSSESNKDDASFTSKLFQNDLLLVALKLQYKLTGETMDDLTRLCNFLCDSESVSKNKYFFDKQFETVNNDFDFYYMVKFARHMLRMLRTIRLANYGAQILVAQI